MRYWSRASASRSWLAAVRAMPFRELLWTRLNTTLVRSYKVRLLVWNMIYIGRIRNIPYRTDMELGHCVTGSMGHLGQLSRPGHRVIILTRCETRVFPVFEKSPKCKTYIWNAEMTALYSHKFAPIEPHITSVGLFRVSTRVAGAYSNSIKLDLYFWARVLDNFVKIYIFVKIRPTVIKILTFNKWSSNFYFPEACKRQTAIKTDKPLAHCKRLPHNYGTNIALPGTMQILLFGAGYKYCYLLTLSSTR